MFQKGGGGSILIKEELGGMLCSRKGREKVDHLLIFDAGLNKLLPGDFSIRVDVHLVEDSLGPVLRALLVSNYSSSLLWSHHGVDGLDDPCHLVQVDPPIAVRVVHTECPVQLFFRRST